MTDTKFDKHTLLPKEILSNFMRKSGRHKTFIILIEKLFSTEDITDIILTTLPSNTLTPHLIIATDRPITVFFMVNIMLHLRLLY